MCRIRSGRALFTAALVFGALLSRAPAAGVRAAVSPPRVECAAGSAGGWQLRTSVKECALRTAAAALAGAVLPLPLAVPLTVALALGAVFSCF